MTGSSDLLRLSRTPDSLAGRAVTLDLHGLSQGEHLAQADDFAGWLRTTTTIRPEPVNTWTRADYVDAIARGGHPEVRRHNDRLRGVWCRARTVHRSLRAP